MQARNAASVLPEPVGAQINVFFLARMCGQPSSCGSVGVPNFATNHSRTSGWAQSSDLHSGASGVTAWVIFCTCNTDSAEKDRAECFKDNTDLNFRRIGRTCPRRLELFQRLGGVFEALAISEEIRPGIFHFQSFLKVAEVEGGGIEAGFHFRPSQWRGKRRLLAAAD